MNVQNRHDNSVRFRLKWETLKGYRVHSYRLEETEEGRFARRSAVQRERKHV